MLCWNSPDKCVLALFVNASFAGDLRDYKSTSGAFMFLVGPNTFVPLLWLCKKQGAISHSSSEAEVISLDMGLRMEGIPAINLWDEVIDVFCLSERGETYVKNQQVTTTIGILESIDYVPPSLPPSKGLAKLVIMEDNDAVIKMTIKGRSPALRHVSRTHRVDLDWLFERIMSDPSIYIKFVSTKLQIADLMTNANFSSDQWH